MVPISRIAFVAALAFVLVACSDSAGDVDGDPEEDANTQEEANNEEEGGEGEEDEEENGDSNDEEPEITYYDDVRPLMNEHCAGCHFPGEGAPIDLHTYEDVQATASLSLTYMESGEMPPWPPDPQCREFQDQRVMPEADIETFRQWVDADTPAGEKPDDYEPFDVQPPPEPDLRAAIFDAPYEPREDLNDEYRCFLLDQTFEEDTYVTGTHVETGGVEVIHHANIFLVNPFQIDTVEELENSESEAGYPCYGDPGFASIDLIGAWVPGAQPIEVPEDSAVIIPAGSRLVMQTHFNTVFADPEPVQPEVTLYTREDPPDYQVRGMPFANMDFLIPAGDSESVHVETYRNSTGDAWTVLGVAPHLHALASHVRVSILHEDSESCLIDVPDWDFNWQQAYRFADDAWVDVQPGDQVELTCTFDNSPANQPIIDGERQEPRDVTWGGRTVDEMCMTFLVVSEPYEPGEDGEQLCDAFNECHAECEDPYGVGCIFNCGSLENDCGICLLDGAQGCANLYCPDELDEATPCLVSCALGAQGGGDIDGCLNEECPEKRDALEECIRPRIEGGMCNDYLTDCNIEL